jgi:hypothetical protein
LSGSCARLAPDGQSIQFLYKLADTNNEKVETGQVNEKIKKGQNALCSKQIYD